MKTYQPFIYIIGWTDANFWYLGARFARNTQPLDLWTKYFTSSKLVAEVRELLGEPDYFETVVFANDEEVRALEAQLIRELELHKDHRWLNRGCFKVNNRSSEERSESMKKHFQNPVNLERNRQLRKEVNSRPEIRAQRRKANLELAKDPAYHQKLREGALRRTSDPIEQERLQKHCAEISRRPEQRLARSEEAKARWQDPEYREKMSAKIKESWQRRKMAKVLIP